MERGAPCAPQGGANPDTLATGHDQGRDHGDRHRLPALGLPRAAGRKHRSRQRRNVGAGPSEAIPQVMDGGAGTTWAWKADCTTTGTPPSPRPLATSPHRPGSPQSLGTHRHHAMTRKLDLGSEIATNELLDWSSIDTSATGCKKHPTCYKLMFEFISRSELNHCAA